MKFLIITHVQHIKSQNNYFGYAPYVREMNIWLKYVNEVQIIAPLVKKEISPIHDSYMHEKISFEVVPEFSLTSVKEIVLTLVKLPNIFSKVYHAMKQADHIHLRCPGNMGLIGALVQILFPKKKKTAKYAGNWDPSAKQPFTYKLQRWILSNPFLTKNMQVLVYGEWPNQTKNIKSFFTATYSENEIQNSEFRIQNKQIKEPISFIFVGTLSKGKQPLYALQLVEELHKRSHQVKLDLYGEGVLRKELENYIVLNQLEAIVVLKGNQSKETVLEVYQKSHFLLLPSKSEGWPKVVAEAMIWGCVPIVTPVSCVPYMLNKGERGILLSLDLEQDIDQIETEIKNKESYLEKAQNGLSWSREFTIDTFELEIEKLVK